MKIPTLFIIILMLYLYLHNMLFNLPVIVGIGFIVLLLTTRRKKKERRKKQSTTSSIHSNSFQHSKSPKKHTFTNKNTYTSTNKIDKAKRYYSQIEEDDNDIDIEEEERIRQAKEDAYYYRKHNGPRHLVEEADDILGLTQKERDYYDDKYAQKCKECNELIDDCICCDECRTYPCECCEKCGEAPRNCRCCRECGEYPCECCEECGYAKCRC